MDPRTGRSRPQTRLVGEAPQVALGLALACGLTYDSGVICETHKWEVANAPTIRATRSARKCWSSKSSSSNGSSSSSKCHLRRPQG